MGAEHPIKIRDINAQINAIDTNRVFTPEPNIVVFGIIFLHGLDGPFSPMG
ncbi:hypothetical protein D1BOALGB6SA_9033 [Olavius sp. associated proteobacterium Delta 1]|nr:hypothetical protein D1BOALGB6SA_9033 [Olavius sp. associated proteobacterium Delta 1]